MRTVTAKNNQTLLDLAIQELGSMTGIWDILDANVGLQIDLSVPAGYKVRIPDSVIDSRVVEYFSRNNINPISGLGDEALVTQNDLNNMKQDLDYNLAGGEHMFAGVRLFFLHDNLSVQIVYEDVTASTVVVSVDQSLDGVNWTSVPYVSQVLDKTKPAHTFNIIGLLTDYVRLHVEVPDASTGTIKSVTWKN
jgi:hypothetical protein